MWTPSIHHDEQKQFIVLFFSYTKNCVVGIFNEIVSSQHLNFMSSQKRMLSELAHKCQANHIFKRTVIKTQG